MLLYEAKIPKMYLKTRLYFIHVHIKSNENINNYLLGYLSSFSLEGRHAHPLLYFPTLSVADWTIESHDLDSGHSDWLNQLSRIPPALLQHTYSL